WNNNRGAATWSDGNTGIRGTISAANSLVGANPGDTVGDFGVMALSNGNYVVGSPGWNGNRGAATWGDGHTGVSGTISALNSLVGNSPEDFVGLTPSMASLSNGNYVVGSSNWNGQRGAVTWGNGSTGVIGTVSVANSLVGSNPGDSVGEPFGGGIV